MSKNLQVKAIALPVNSLDAYFQSVNRIPLLTEAEEKELAHKLYYEGDVDAARRLVMAHLRFVARVANGYLGYGLPLADLIQEGNIGLMKAVKRFNPEVGVRLVSFAVHWIKAEMYEFIMRNWRVVKIATTKAQRKLFYNLRQNKKRLGWLSKDEVDNLAKDLNVSRANVLAMEERMNVYHDVSFDAHVYDDEEAPMVPANYLEDKRYSPASLVESADSMAKSQANLQLALATLDERSQSILAERWLSEKKMTLQQLAERYAVSPERIRQIEKSAMAKLRDQL